MKRLAILGASGHGKVVADCAELSGWDQVVFFDDAWPSKTINGHWPIHGDTAALIESVSNFDGVVVGIGNNRIRQDKLRMLSATGANLPVIAHPSALVSRYATVGDGSVLIAGSIINIDSVIGMGAIINTGASVGHDCSIGNAVHIAPGAKLAGGVSVGDRTWVGVGSAVRQMLRIGADVTIGAGAAVIKDVPDRATAVGVPARLRSLG